jgi:flagellar biosynthesis/type III secretory pathway protein FliH
VLRREVVLAEERARQLVAAAEKRAAEIVGEAERAAARVRLRAEEEGRADAAAALAARALSLKVYEARADERQLDRIAELAKLLAERLLGEALELDPERVVALARQALREARGARRIKIQAHPDDIVILERSLFELGVDAELSEFDAAPELPRGNLRIMTDIGILDAELAPQLERLALKLRESLAQ